ncbi:GtrA family protein [Lactiplantibacillus mudanjiangensis]|uniref:GtrA family protein [Lactobacillus pentosus] n=1 Tax=Lactiplantibacillus mudanjiangensis TaxID=1296538 RepID=A0A660E0U2_9LACO|nr:GtrA family protein [Lactiplantibacillus mudanjiangensis]VDG18848.1 GtrA family protein [Lactobacillus pentosus] [Lactiplantibacillus mudanjiangensis]VDG25373.1 GtrA family protein [Lactobacillus pentosus] [Lactiplantibacillus mudanjiangensis]VDG27596.1 GtrA family protein [Lactobacillus pentosus] [Lactiplantibacillus mudanjiangensis]VDG32947.1 GtrA family protein [Lactobacillus pentosus] [Lactiplantibacillus mudanjiangensis]
MIKLIQQLWHRYQAVLAYLIFGGLTTVINFVAFWLFNNLIQWPYLISNVIAWLLSVLFAYVTNKLWVFDAATPTLKSLLQEAGAFFGFRLLSLGIDELIMFTGISILHGNPLLVKLLDQIIVVVLNWFFSKLFIFKERH